jgi:large subunit ribosomal protein L4e
MSRPTVAVYSNEGNHKVASTQVLPAVFTAPIRNDIVHFVHSNIAKNRRQAQGVTILAGH